MGCGRTENEHAAQHYAATKHPLAVNLKTKMVSLLPLFLVLLIFFNWYRFPYQVWCYACDIFLEELSLSATDRRMLELIHERVNLPALTEYVCTTR